MIDTVRAVVERLLPWYDPEQARKHDALTERIRLRSIAARQTSERVRGLTRRQVEQEQLATAVRNTNRALRAGRR